MDIGAESREEAEKKVSVGEMLPFIWGSWYRQAPHCFLPIWMTVWGA